MKYQIFHTIEESENYCFSATVIEKKNKLFFNAQKTPFNTNKSLKIIVSQQLSLKRKINFFLTLKKHHLIQILLYGEHHPWNF